MNTPPPRPAPARPVHPSACLLTVTVACAATCVDPPPRSPDQSSGSAAETPSVLDLWPDQENGEDVATRPVLFAYVPEAAGATGTGVIVIPGGGYDHLAMGHEGHEVARWLVERGVAAFVLRYRVGPRNRHPVPLEDARRAVRLVRLRARELEIRVDRVGLLGFSAGGHLAGTAAAYAEPGSPNAPNAADRISSAPDFLVFAYPVVTLVEDFAHAPSRRALLGATPPAAVMDSLSIERQVEPGWPPVFLVHAASDPVVDADNTLALHQALTDAGVPSRLHVFEKGGHGFGLASWDPVLSAWPGLLERWLADLGLVPPSPQRAP